MTQSALLLREAAAQRAGLSATLGQLRDGVTTQALSAELVGVLRDSSLSVVKSLAEGARSNPAAALLIGAGLTMMLTRTTGADVMSAASSALKTATAAGSDAATAAATTVKDAAGSVADKAKNLADEASDTVSGLSGKVAGAVSETAASLKDKASGAAGSLRSTTDDAALRGQGLLDQGKDQARHINEEATKLATDTRQAMTRLLEEQPILVAAIGTAIGALLGAALPISQTERDLLGKMGAEAIGTGREALDKAKDFAVEEIGDAQLGQKAGQAVNRLVDSMVPPPQAG